MARLYKGLWAYLNRIDLKRALQLVWQSSPTWTIARILLLREHPRLTDPSRESGMLPLRGQLPLP
ncbi:MAG: hypothetical protein ACR9NN_17655 [Nostochopsis sp.]